MALHAEHARGYAEALARYGVKQAFDWRGAVSGAFGRPIEAVRQLRAGTAFQKGKLLDPHALLWGSSPTAEQLAAIKPGNPASALSRGWASTRRGWMQAEPWLNRAFTVGLPAYEAFQALKGKGDPNEGRLSNTLGALGSGLGWAFGQPIAGWVGAPYVSQLGRAIGVGAGRLLGSRPAPPPQPVYAGNPGGDEYGAPR